MVSKARGLTPNYFDFKSYAKESDFEFEFFGIKALFIFHNHYTFLLSYLYYTPDLYNCQEFLLNFLTKKDGKIRPNHLKNQIL